jgi:hypothetical protein
MDLYEEIFNNALPNRMNPNGCSIKGTFFVSHKYTNYAFVQELHRKGHEIAVFSLTHKDDPKYWTGGSYDDWLAEMAGARLITERYLILIHFINLLTFIYLVHLLKLSII